MIKSNKYYISFIIVLALLVIPLVKLSTNEAVNNDTRSKAATVVSTCLRSKPSLDINPKQQEGLAGQILQYTLNIKNNDSNLCSSSVFYGSSFELENNWVQEPKYFEINLKPGERYKRTVYIKSAADAKAGPHFFTELIREGISDSEVSYETKTKGIFTIKNLKVSFVSPVNNLVLGKNSVLPIETVCAGAELAKSTEIYMDNKLLQRCTNTNTCKKIILSNSIKAGSHEIKTVCKNKVDQNTSSVTVIKN